ncbi:MAG: MBL fold metallo-hydrolase [Deinococcota bacterium]|nr:MBL fold metallo-hydrolase [Deinococcota bacterium]
MKAKKPRRAGTKRRSAGARNAGALRLWRFGALLVIVLAMAALAYSELANGEPGGNAAGVAGELPLQIVFFDVGQGDAALIRAPGGQTVLIDGGRDRGMLSRYLQDLEVERLDLVIASHADLDHIGGLSEAVASFRPRFFMDNGVPHSTQAYQALLSAVAEVGATYLEATARTISLGPASLAILPPPRRSEDQNDNSVGAVLDYGGFRAVFSGDATTRTQDYWSEAYGRRLSGVQVYKSAHHGSSTGDAPEFMRLLSPQTVVISVGEGNQYGHPTPEALSSYEGAGATVYRTDRQGHITVSVSSLGGYEVTTGALPRWLPADPLQVSWLERLERLLKHLEALFEGLAR